MKKIIKYVGVIALGNILIKMLGFIREVAISYKFGASPITDAYLVAFTIPLILFQFLGVGYATSIIKVLSSLEEKVQEKRVFISRVFSYTLLTSILLLFLGLVFSKPIVKIFSPGLEPQTIELASELLRLSMPMVISSMIIAISSGILQYSNKFAIDVWSNLPNNLIIIISIVCFSGIGGIYAVTLSTVIGSLTILLIQLPFSLKYGLNLRLDFKVDENLNKFVKILIPATLLSMVQMIGALINRFIASFMENGSISILYFADRLYNLPYLVVVMAITTVFFPKLVSLFNNNELAKFKIYVAGLFKVIIILMTSIAIVMFVLRQELVEIVYQRGSFSKEAVSLTATCFGIYSLGIIFLSLRELFIKIYFCLNDTKILLMNSLYMFLLNLILGIVLSYFYGIYGLAASTPLSVLISSLYLYKNLKMSGYLNVNKFFLIKYLMISCITFVVAKVFLEIFYRYTDNLLLIVTVISFIVISIYGSLIWIFRLIPKFK
ncbi:murein biosynthesis integral membrane protein MurJ [Bacillus thuringiensis]|uniref:Probable lipid II flippase MurJ n=2 Tax=Bacillus cereus group TaxID=86661 RepID=B7IQS1_BACC2|nr:MULTISPECIES: murein biosynthesis integral membrane protein MurJ [Bacillus cereus group]ACK95631.1 integral membrane protein MviN [Bacillus cereus G9842]MDR4134912.1 murein biosynthesis integral membrane protein MurJ [Bacillus cereus]MDR4366893.1 murein biosynthesis integral membrane protein MurJ [Bacillus cereus]MED2486636.1 murein biosynthesis integral membrane protein MurJ [Bacillus thuringiensis]PER89540.1 murein biosynthesis integral membrane protein MurJ [Bacillus thuringiensis]